MTKPESLTRLLEAAEAAAPVDAVAAVTREVGLRLRATSASFLIADTSGRALVRLAHVPLQPRPARAVSTSASGQRREGEESARIVSFDGGPLERVVRRQRVEVVAGADRTGRGDWTVLAPVTERGEVIGALELRLPEDPVATPSSRSRSWRTCWRS